jgi:hypothetical protein
MLAGSFLNECTNRFESSMCIGAVETGKIAPQENFEVLCFALTPIAQSRANAAIETSCGFPRERDEWQDTHLQCFVVPSWEYDEVVVAWETLGNSGYHLHKKYTSKKNLTRQMLNTDVYDFRRSTPFRSS